MSEAEIHTLGALLEHTDKLLHFPSHLLREQDGPFIQVDGDGKFRI